MTSHPVVLLDDYTGFLVIVNVGVVVDTLYIYSLKDY